MDVGPDPGVASMLAGQADHLGVHVGGDDRHLQRLLPQVAGLLASFGPEFDRHLRPRLGNKGAVPSRWHIAGDEGRLNRDRAAPAEGVDQNAIAVPVAELDQSSCEGLLERSLGRHLAIASLVQALARGVDREQRPIVEQRDFDRVLGAFLVEPNAVVLGLEPLDDGLLNGPLDTRSGSQHRLDRLGIDREFGVDAQPLFPRHLLGSFEELLEVGAVKLAHDELHAVGGAEPKVGFADRGEVALKPDATILDSGLSVPEFLDLALDDCFESKRRRGDEFYLFHDVLNS